MSNPLNNFKFKSYHLFNLKSPGAQGTQKISLGTILDIQIWHLQFFSEIHSLDNATTPSTPKHQHRGLEEECTTCVHFSEKVWGIESRRLLFLSFVVDDLDAQRRRKTGDEKNETNEERGTGTPANDHWRASALGIEKLKVEFGLDSKDLKSVNKRLDSKDVDVECLFSKQK